MAYDLKAVIRLTDKASRPLKNLTKQVERTQKYTEKLTRATEQQSRASEKLRGAFSRVTTAGRDVINVNRRMSQSIRNVGSGVSGIRGQFVGLAAAIGGAAAAKGLFDKTIGAAAQYERSSITIGAMFNDAEKSQKFIKRMENLAIDSPLLNSNDIMSNSSGFVAITKDLDKLEHAFKLVEKLNVKSPEQGVSGAAFALRELFSGDARSISERFEMPKDLMNEIKKMSFDDQLKALDKYFDRIGIGERTIKALGDTTLGIWNQIKEKTDVVMRTMGQPALVKIRDFLDDVNRNMENGDKSGFIKYGQDILSALAEGFISGTKTVGRFVNNLINDPEFIAQKGILNKAYFVMDTLHGGFRKWVEEGGQDKINKVATSVIDIIGDAIQENSVRVTEVGMSLGKALGEGVMKGIGSYIKENWKSLLDFALFGVRGQLSGESLWNGEGTNNGILGGVPKRYHGEDYVPKDNKLYSLHKGEMILPKQQADSYRNGGGKGDINVTINYSGERLGESEVDDIMRLFTRKLSTAGSLGHT